MRTAFQRAVVFKKEAGKEGSWPRGALVLQSAVTVGKFIFLKSAIHDVMEKRSFYVIKVINSLRASRVMCLANSSPRVSGFIQAFRF